MEFELQGKKLFSIGKLPLERHELSQLVRDQKGDFASSLSKKLDFIITGEKISSKEQEKADALKIPYINYEKFRSMLNKDFMEFNLNGIDGTEPPDELLKKLSEKNWRLWFADHEVKEMNRDKLFTILKNHENAHQITEVHKFCSEQLIEAYCLSFMHPYHHFSDIKNYDVSADHNYLATCSTHGAESEQPVILQVWDLRTCKPVNQIKLGPYVGVYQFENPLTGIRWSPDSSMIAVAHHLNVTGVFDAYSGRKKSEAGITNGSPSGTVHYWSADSKHVMIGWPYYEKLGVKESEDVEKNVTWLPSTVEAREYAKVFDESMKLAEPGKETDHPVIKKQKHSEQIPEAIKGKYAHQKGSVYYTTPDRIIAISVASISFFDQNGELLNEYRFGKPHELYTITDHVAKLMKGYPVSPVFPVPNGSKEYGIVSFMSKSNKTIYASPDYDFKKDINISFGGKYSWPFDWVSGIAKREVGEVSSDPDLSLSF